MAEDMRSISNLVFRFQEFAKLRRQVREEVSLTSSQSLSMFDQPFGDYIYDKQKQRSPSCGHRRDFAELRDQLKWQALCNKHSGHHREQRELVLKVGLRDDKEFEQI
jgi:hypothetical protein